MSYIPNTRERIKTPLFGINSATPEENPYWEGYLNEEDSREIAGFDLAVDTMLNDLKHNADRLSVVAGYLGVEANDCLKLLNSSILFDTSKLLEDMAPEELENYSHVEIVLKAIIDFLSSALESMRNETIISMIESYDQKEYENLKEEVDKGKKNAILRLAKA